MKHFSFAAEKAQAYVKELKGKHMVRKIGKTETKSILRENCPSCQESLVPVIL
jgi:hypothetical protein